MKLSIVIPSSGRKSLVRTLKSVGTFDGEIVVAHDGGNRVPDLVRESGVAARSVQSERQGPWGRSAILSAMQAAQGEWITFIGDDDVYTSGAPRKICEELNGKRNPVAFTMRRGAPFFDLLGSHKRFEVGHIGSEMFALPNDPRKWGAWGATYEGDWKFMEETVRNYDGALDWSGHHTVTWRAVSRVSVLTPSRDRPKSFEMVQRCMMRQTIPIHEWIIVRDGDVEYDYQMAQQKVFRRHGRPGELHSVCSNLIDGLSRVTGDMVAIVPDDDWYDHKYLERVAAALDESGEPVCFAGGPVFVYNVQTKRMVNVSGRGYPDLGQISFRTSHPTNPLGYFDGLCRRGDPNLDRCMWRNWHGGRVLVENNRLHLALRGVSGTAAVNPIDVGASDSELKLLQEFTGADYNIVQSC